MGDTVPLLLYGRLYSPLPAQGWGILSRYYFTTDFTPCYQPTDGRYCPAIIIRQTVLPVTSPGMHGRYCPAIIIRQTLLPVTSTGMGDTHQLLHIRQTLLAITSPGMGDSTLLLLHDRFYSMLFPLKQFSKIIARKGHNTLCLINCIIIYSHIYTIPKIIWIFA